MGGGSGTVAGPGAAGGVAGGALSAASLAAAEPGSPTLLNASAAMRPGMAAPAGAGGAVTRPHSAHPTAHMRLALDSSAAALVLGDSVGVPLQLHSKEGVEVLPHSALPSLMLPRAIVGGLGQLCGLGVEGGIGIPQLQADLDAAFHYRD
jgi:hypothetical protein